MRTRNQSKLNKEDPTGDSSTHSNSAAKSHDEEGSLAKASKEGVGKLLHRAKSRRGRKECRPSDETNEKSPRENGELNKEHIPDFGLKGYVSGNVAKSSSNISRGVEGSVHCDANEMDWEVGTISASEFREDYSHEHGREVTVEFTDSPSSAQKKRSRRTSAEEKASILSLLPSYLLKIMEIPRLKANMLGSLVHWVAALSVALFRALNLRTRHMVKKKRGENQRREKETKLKLCPGGFSCSPPLLLGSVYGTPISTLHPYIRQKTPIPAAKTTKLAPKAIASRAASCEEEHQAKTYEPITQFCLQLMITYMYFPRKTGALMKRAWSAQSDARVDFPSKLKNCS